MLTQLIRQPSVRGIAAGSKATVEIPTVATHHRMFLHCKTGAGVALTRAQILADIGNIFVKLNGQTIMEGDVQFFLDRQKYYGDAIGAGNVDGIIPIVFTRPHMATLSERIVTALGMQDVQSFTVEIEVTAIAQLSTIEVTSEIDPSRRTLGQHVRLTKHPQSFGVTGDQEISTLPKFGNDVGYLALHIEDSAGTIVEATVKLGGNAIYEKVGVAINEVLLNEALRTPQTGYYHIDFAKNNDLLSLLPMAGVQDFRQIINWSVLPGNFNIYAETIHGLRVAK